MHYRFPNPNSTSYFATPSTARRDRRSKFLRNALFLLAALYSVTSLGSSTTSPSLLAQTQPPAPQTEANLPPPQLPPELPDAQPPGTEEVPKDDPIFQKILEAIQESPPSLSAPPISKSPSSKLPRGASQTIGSAIEAPGTSSNDSDPFSEIANFPTDVAKQISDEATWQVVDSLLRSSKLLIRLSQQLRSEGDVVAARRMESLALRMRREIVLLLHPPTIGSNLQGDGIQPLEETIPPSIGSSKSPE